MIKGRKCHIYTLSGVMVLIIFIVNVYFLHIISSEPQDAKKVKTSTQDYNTSNKPSYYNVNRKFYFFFEQLRKQLRYKTKDKTTDVWDVARKWTTNGFVYLPTDPRLANVLQAMRTYPIIRAENSPKGTQFKLSLTLQGNQTVLFKPQWYKRNYIIKGGVYSGKDRHTAEVAAFYLSLLLDIRWVPLAVTRKLNIKKDIWDVAPEHTRKTMYIQGKNSTICMYGKCLYCRQNESVCGDFSGEVEGAVILVVGGSLRKYRSPWQRTYSQHKTADWEHNDDYCSGVKKQLPLLRILDLVDGSIIDFLLQNGDRHHYETLMDRVVLLDNGKGLGNPYKDHNDILAPLYQCCIIRTSTWEHLKLLSGGSLSSALAILTADEVEPPILTEDHLIALDRRLLTVYATVDACVAKHGRLIFKNK